ncbi:MAG: CvpA family protein [Planctomycetota bacterium]
MNWMDLVILSLLALGVGLGVRTGFIWTLGKLVALVAATIATAWFHEPVGNYLARTMANDTGARLLSYSLTFALAYGAVYLVTWLIEWKVRKVKTLKVTDRVLGGAIGLVKTGFILGAVLMGFAVYPIAPVEEPMAESDMARYLVMGMQKVIVAVPDHYRQDLSKFADRVWNFGKKTVSDGLSNALDEAAKKTGATPSPTPGPESQPPAKPQGK